jgi:hypothetical protein
MRLEGEKMQYPVQRLRVHWPNGLKIPLHGYSLPFQVEYGMVSLQYH